jgi:hypothetical protein
LDDLLTHTKDDATHLKELQEVLETLRKNDLRANLAKCKFGARQIEFLGHQCQLAGISPEHSKLQAISNWPMPKSAQELHAFLGLASWFRRFIPQFSKITNNLQLLLTSSKKGTQGKSKSPIALSEDWGPRHQEEFDNLKRIMTSDKCVLPVFDPAKKTALWTDASEFAAGAVLLQLVDVATDSWKPVSFYSSRFNSAEVNYDVRDRELTAMVKALDTWAPLLLSC